MIERDNGSQIGCFPVTGVGVEHCAMVGIAEAVALFKLFICRDILCRTRLLGKPLVAFVLYSSFVALREIDDNGALRTPRSDLDPLLKQTPYSHAAESMGSSSRICHLWQIAV
jgi:hypothetical protein